MTKIFSKYKGYLDRINPLSSETKADPVVIEKIRNGDKAQLEAIYKAHKVEFVNWITTQYNCSEEDAQDIYQFAIITFYENIKNEKLSVLNSSVKTYLFAIGKHKALEQKKAAVKYRYLQENQEQGIADIGKWDDDLYEESLQLVEKCLEKLGEPCKSLLELYYFHSLSMEEIADKMNYKNRFTSKNLKYKCVNRLRRLYLEELKKSGGQTL
ncbi:MAG: sigma-70 family RNA polymerase sigma factor [Cyclobacteriaceae bacterium]|nr:sigma-70 family RNA polymerase sigma factor [Cyclobacteriaceae bacterium]